MRFHASHAGIAMLVTAFGLLVGCSQKAGEQTGGEAGKAVESTAASAPKGETRTYTFRGIVRKIDRDRNRLTLEHENIGDWMQAMTMPFPVAEPAMLDQVQQDKPYRFTIEVSQDSYKLTKIEPDSGS